MSDLLRKLAGGSRPLAGIGVCPPPATTAAFLMMVAASAASRRYDTTRVGESYRVQAYDARAGFVDDLTTSYDGGVASVVAPDGGTETGTAACRIGRLSERRYQHT